MGTAEQYRAYASEAERRAAAARRPEEREAHLQMARTWRQLEQSVTRTQSASKPA
ncbi:hypothetical protein [Phenylobacterium sp.]|jgi:hypothetical protein|uniref:hypothetical protein n=1 Tax=Phenylobacterium sp. TaxID=1871053 RepID=UPI002F956DBF